MPSTYGKKRGWDGYDQFRTGLTFSDVRSMLWSNDFDSSTWKYKRRRTVLGIWHSLKLDMWREVQRREDERELQRPHRRRATGGG